MILRIKIFIILTILSLIVIFMLQNVQPVVVRFLTFQYTAPLIGVISILALAGFIAGFLTGLVGGRRRK
ncbi:LapA family protein [bacterium]|nr:LapA family protein [bacterium]